MQLSLRQPTDEAFDLRHLPILSGWPCLLERSAPQHIPGERSISAREAGEPMLLSVNVDPVGIRQRPAVLISAVLIFPDGQREAGLCPGPLVFRAQHCAAKRGCGEKQALRSTRASHAAPGRLCWAPRLKGSLAPACTSGAKNSWRGEVIFARGLVLDSGGQDEVGPSAAWRTPTDAGYRGSKCTGR
jgi:hypothetical protein